LSKTKKKAVHLSFIALPVHNNGSKPIAGLLPFNAIE